MVLSAASAAPARRRSSGNEGGKLTADGLFYGRENDAFEKTTAQRRAEHIFPLNNNANKERGPSIGSGCAKFLRPFSSHRYLFYFAY